MCLLAPGIAIISGNKPCFGRALSQKKPGNLQSLLKVATAYLTTSRHTSRDANELFQKAMSRHVVTVVVI